MYVVSGSRRRGQTRRDSDSSVAPRSAAFTEGALVSARSHLRVRPCPAFGEVRKLVDRSCGCGDAQNRKRGCACRRDAHAGLFAHDDEAQPRPQLTARVGVRRREQPWKVGPIEFDAGQEVRLEVAAVGQRLHAHDLPRIDADDVRRPAQPNRYRHPRRAVDRQRGRQVGDTALREQRVRGRDRRRGALAHPRQEAQVGSRISHSVTGPSLRARAAARPARWPRRD